MNTSRFFNRFGGIALVVTLIGGIMAASAVRAEWLDHRAAQPRHSASQCANLEGWAFMECVGGVAGGGAPIPYGSGCQGYKVDGDGVTPVSSVHGCSGTGCSWFNPSQGRWCLQPPECAPWNGDTSRGTCYDK